MPTTTLTDFECIRNYLYTIKHKPKKHGVFFFFQEEDDIFIVDGNRVKLLPPKYERFKNYAEFFIRVDLKKRIVMFSAWDIKDWTAGELENEVDSFMEWDEVEKAIRSFFDRELENLTESTTPYADSHRDHVFPQQRFEDYSAHRSSFYGNSYTAPSYKEREAFFDRIKACVIDNRTPHAIDFVNEEIAKLVEAKKFDDIDSILRFIAFEKLNVPLMLTFLKATQPHSASIQARAAFLDKVRVYIGKAKPVFAKVLLDGLEKAA